LIKDQWLVNYCKTLFTLAPEYFWTIEASITKKHHPPDDVSFAGLVHHTKKVTYMGIELVEAMSIGDTKDEVIAACLFHDIVKYGSSDIVNPTNSYAWFQQHDIHGAEFFLRSCEIKPIPEKVQVIANAIEKHNGRWSKTSPSNKLEWTVHFADYTMSRNKVVMKLFPGEELHTPTEKVAF